MKSNTRRYLRVSFLLLFCLGAVASTPTDAQQTPDPNAYYDTLCKTPGALCYSLRTQAQIDTYKNRTGEVKVNYDATMDAAKWSWIRDDESAENLRLPILLERPATGTRRLLIITDHRWDASWFTEFKKPGGDFMGGWKWMQITCASADIMDPTPNPRQRICVEPQMVAIGALHQPGGWLAGATPPPLSVFGVREYQGWRAPTTLMAYCNGKYMGELLAPIANCFKAYPNTWTRVWLDITMTAGDKVANFSMYMADENQAPVPVVLNAQVVINSPVREFWYEYDTSVAERVGGPMAAWGRNVVVLKDVDPTPLLVKPITGGVVVPPPPPPAEICGNKIDDNGDGRVDEGCPVDPPPPPPPVEVCGNGIDDDKDGQIDEGCTVTPPPCTDVPSLFVTRWKMTSGREGSRMAVEYQASSQSPIVETVAKINGKPVATAKASGKDDDLEVFGSMWLTTPAPGTYDLSVWVKNAAGCTKEAASLVKLTVK